MQVLMKCKYCLKLQPVSWYKSLMSFVSYENKSIVDISKLWVILLASPDALEVTCLGKPQHKKSTVQTVFVQIAFQPPHPQANGRFVGAIFAENLSIF